jgi:cell shape-determining protein MreD
VIPYIVYSCICILIIILKTAVLSNFALFDNFYDILLPFVLYLGLFRPFSQGLPLILLYGVCMDSITGGPFGIYISVYFLLFIAMRWTIQFVHARSMLLKPFIVIVGVLVENLIFIMLLVVFHRNRLNPASFLHSASIQLLWAAVTGPFFLMIIDYTQTQSSNWFEEWDFQRKENRS